jgi:PHD-finger
MVLGLFCVCCLFAVGAKPCFLSFPTNSFTCIWDPNLADEAERRGEDISGFLRGDLELKARENRMMLLHQNGYSVASALKALQSLQYEPSSMLTQEEAKTFDAIILNKKTRKQFAVVSETLQRSRADCQIHYYKWKKTNRSYEQLKRDLKEFGRYSEYCVVCEDGGDLIVCDGCSGPYHLECVSPPLKEEDVPDGDWFCPKCERVRKMKPNIADFSPLSPSSRRRSLHLAPPHPSPRPRNSVTNGI